MGRRTRTAARPWTALAVAIGVLLSSEASLSRPASGPRLESSPAPSCATEEGACCIDPAPSAEACCSCCRPVEPGERPEPDGRSTLGPVKPKADLGPAPAVAALDVDAPRPTPGAAPLPDDLASGRPLYLLNARLRF